VFLSGIYDVMVGTYVFGAGLLLSCLHFFSLPG